MRSRRGDSLRRVYGGRQGGGGKRALLCRKCLRYAQRALACARVGAKLLYISTDYVFDGKGCEPFEVDSPKDPQNYYGLTKSLGEDEVAKLIDRYFIVRVSWVFGKSGNNFVNTMLRLGKERSELKVVNDQIGSPTYTYDLAKLLCGMIVTEKYGTYHATNEGYCSWAEFAQEIFRFAGYPTKVNPIPSIEFPAKAVRPQNSRMSKISLERNGFNLLPTWQDALRRFLYEINKTV